MDYRDDGEARTRIEGHPKGVNNLPASHGLSTEIPCTNHSTELHDFYLLCKTVSKIFRSSIYCNVIYS